jgi:hypothetical protein
MTLVDAIQAGFKKSFPDELRDTVSLTQEELAFIAAELNEYFDTLPKGLMVEIKEEIRQLGVDGFSGRVMALLGYNDTPPGGLAR